MTSRIGSTHRTIQRKDGRIVLVEVKKRYDVCTKLKRKNSKRVRVARKGQQA